MNLRALALCSSLAIAAGGVVHVADLAVDRNDFRQTRTPPLPAYRPSSLGDLVDAVSANKDGLDDVDLSGDVADYSLYLGDGVGIAARLQEDPDGSVFVAWQRRREPWLYRFLDDDTAAGVRIPRTAVTRLGRIAQFRPVGTHFVLETQSAESPAASMVMRADLSALAFVAGTVLGVLRSEVLVTGRVVAKGEAAFTALDRVDVRGGRVDVIYPGARDSLGGAPAAVLSATHSIRDVQVDMERGTVTFSAGINTSAAGTTPRPTRMTCTLTTPPVRCEPARR